MKTLLDCVIKYRDKFVLRPKNGPTEKFDGFSFFSEDNRILSKPFMRLPTAKELPEYYEMIKTPVDFNKIKVKLKRKEKPKRTFSSVILEKTFGISVSIVGRSRG